MLESTVSLVAAKASRMSGSVSCQATLRLTCGEEDKKPPIHLPFTSHSPLIRLSFTSPYLWSGRQEADRGAKEPPRESAGQTRHARRHQLADLRDVADRGCLTPVGWIQGAHQPPCKRFVTTSGMNMNMKLVVKRPHGAARVVAWRGGAHATNSEQVSSNKLSA